MSILDTLQEDLSPLMQAKKTQDRCAQFGFDWDTLGPVAEKVQEELNEVIEEALMIEINQTRVEEELGDLLFAVVNLARHLDCCPESALAKANLKFAARFRKVEEKLLQKGKNLQKSTLDEMEAMWDEVKKEETNEAHFKAT